MGSPSGTPEPAEGAAAVRLSDAQLAFLKKRSSWRRTLLRAVGTGLLVGLIVGLFVGRYTHQDRWALDSGLGVLPIGFVVMTMMAVDERRAIRNDIAGGVVNCYSGPTPASLTKNTVSLPEWEVTVKSMGGGNGLQQAIKSVLDMSQEGGPVFTGTVFVLPACSKTLTIEDASGRIVYDVTAKRPRQEIGDPVRGGESGS